jgi:hypothetical protein
MYNKDFTYRAVVLEQRVLVQNVVDLGQDFGGGYHGTKSGKHLHLQKPEKNKQKLPLVIVVAKVCCSLATTARNSASSFS